MGWISDTLGGAVDTLTDSLGITSPDAQAAEGQPSQDTGVDWGNVGSNVASALIGGAGGAAAGYYVGSRVSGRAPRRRRKRRYPTALQWARFEQANDMLKNHPNAPAMRRQLSWRFFSRYKWI